LGRAGQSLGVELVAGVAEPGGLMHSPTAARPASDGLRFASEPDPTSAPAADAGFGSDQPEAGTVGAHSFGGVDSLLAVAAEAEPQRPDRPESAAPSTDRRAIPPTLLEVAGAASASGVDLAFPSALRAHGD
jgi:hypothetical protein